MKRIFPVLLISFGFLFSGCFGSEEETQENKNLESIIEYSIDIPQDWEVFPKEEYPQSVVFSAREPLYSSSLPAIVAVSKELSRPQSLDQFIKRNLEEVRKNSQDFKQISEENIESKNSQSRLVYYQERRSVDNSVLGIYSFYVLPNNQQESYVITLLFDENIEGEKKEKFKKLVTSFVVTEIKKEETSEN